MLSSLEPSTDRDAISIPERGGPAESETGDGRAEWTIVPQTLNPSRPKRRDETRSPRTA